MIGIIEYGAGNLFSLSCALDRLNIPYGFIKHPDEMDLYDRYIIPGVGHAGMAMDKLKKSGLIEPILKTQKKVLGICVGMQLLSRFSEEGNADLLSVFPLDTLRFSSDHRLKVPHMGWNKIHQTTEDEIFRDIPQNAYFYFVHSYYIEFNPKFAIGSSEYGNLFSSIIHFNNFWGVQFHPEKSGTDGEKVLRNFNEL